MIRREPYAARQSWPASTTSPGFSDEPGALTRLYLSPAHKAATRQVAAWMEEAGMAARLDAVGNVAGRYEGERPGLPALLLGSHIDTVRNAGRYDGNLGVLAAIQAVAELHAKGERLPFAIEVAGLRRRGGRALPHRRWPAAAPSPAPSTPPRSTPATRTA